MWIGSPLGSASLPGFPRTTDDDVFGRGILDLAVGVGGPFGCGGCGGDGLWWAVRAVSDRRGGAGGARESGGRRVAASPLRLHLPSGPVGQCATGAARESPVAGCSPSRGSRLGVFGVGGRGAGWIGLVPGCLFLGVGW